MKPRVRHASALCMTAALVPLLAGCASDAIVDSLRPSPADQAAKPEPPPAGTVAELVRLGDTMREKGDPQGAILFYRRAHARDHFNPAPLVGLGEALDDLGAYNDAAEAFRQALIGRPADADALRGLGNALLGLDQPALAIDQFEAALRARPDARCHNGIGVARDRLGDQRVGITHVDCDSLAEHVESRGKVGIAGTTDLARAEALIEDGISPGYACSQIARKIGVDGAELALLWQRKDQSCARARGALQGPAGHDTTTKTKATTAARVLPVPG